MTVLAGPLHIVCCVLAIAGLAKVASPGPTRRSLDGVGIRVPLFMVRALGVVEIVVSAVTIGGGGVIAPAVVAALHLGFVGFVVLTIRRGSTASCGCFGSADTPPSIVHVVANLASAGVAAVAIGVDGLGDVLSGQPAGGLPYMGFVALGSAALLLALIELPKLTGRALPVTQEFSMVRR